MVEIENQLHKIVEVVDLAEVRARGRQLASTKSACAEIWLFAALVRGLIIVPLLTATLSLISESVYLIHLFIYMYKRERKD